MFDVMDKWEFQPRGVEMLRNSIRTGHRRPMCSVPTGGGKTNMVMEVTKSALQQGKRTMFTVPAIELIDQTVMRFYRHGIRDVGVIQGNHYMTDYAKPVQIASVQTLMRRGLDNLPKIDIANIDEAHITFEFVKEWFGVAPYPIIGWSATPFTRGLGTLYDDLVQPITMRELMDRGVLCNHRFFAPSDVDLSEVRTTRDRNGDVDYQVGDLRKAMDRSTIYADILRSWQRYGEGRATLGFGVDRVHAQRCAQMFTDAGVRCAYIDGETSKDERKRIRLAFEAGDIQMVWSVGCLIMGVDWDVRCIICARPTKSEQLWVQMLGRGMRAAEAKDDCIILDHTKNVETLGFPEDIVFTELDNGALRKKADVRKIERLPTKCPKCAAIKTPGIRECFECGFVTEPQTRAKVVDAELREIERADVVERQHKQAFYSGLLYYARAKGKKDGWAYFRFQQKFKCEPRGLQKITMEPTDEVLGFIRHCNMARAFATGKAKRKAKAA